jgi:hypothetical protein
MSKSEAKIWLLVQEGERTHYPVFFVFKLVLESQTYFCFGSKLGEYFDLAGGASDLTAILLVRIAAVSAHSSFCRRLVWQENG